MDLDMHQNVGMTAHVSFVVGNDCMLPHHGDMFLVMKERTLDACFQILAHSVT